MDSETFARCVENHDIPGIIVKRLFGVTERGQRYALVINQVVWLKIRLFYEGVDRVIVKELSEHLTYKGAEKKLDEYRYRLERSFSIANI